MLMFQASPALNADLRRPLPRLLVFRAVRRSVCPADAAIQPYLLLRRAYGPPLTKLKALCRRRQLAPLAPLP